MAGLLLGCQYVNLYSLFLYSEFIQKPKRYAVFFCYNLDFEFFIA